MKHHSILFNGFSETIWCHRLCKCIMTVQCQGKALGELRAYLLESKCDGRHVESSHWVWVRARKEVHLGSERRRKQSSEAVLMSPASLFVCTYSPSLMLESSSRSGTSLSTKTLSTTQSASNAYSHTQSLQNMWRYVWIHNPQTLTHTHPTRTHTQLCTLTVFQMNCY